ncbi:MAG: carbon-nitrogen hydrolase family protein [Planctomycetes bacterium]|nr:carbon-nitrogen hydrolase family protein [Planctomycetota bacterium]
MSDDRSSKDARKGLAALPLWFWVIFFAGDAVVLGAVAWRLTRTQEIVVTAEDLDEPKAITDSERLVERPPESPPGTYRVAAIQFVSEFGNLKGNRERLAKFIREAAEHGAKIVVMPEAAVPGYMSHDLQTAWRDPARRKNPKDGRSLEEDGAAEPVPGPSTEYFGTLAKELKIYIVVALIEKVEREKSVDYFNTAILMGPDGSIRCHYRKLHPWPIGEATWAQPGDKGLGLCDTEFGRLGLMICFDLSNGVPEQLKEKCAGTILYPIGWVCPNAREWFDGMLPEKTKDWGVNLVGANWSISEKEVAGADWQGFGSSRIVSADGMVQARGEASGEGILYADLLLPGEKP